MIKRILYNKDFIKLHKSTYSPPPKKKKRLYLESECSPTKILSRGKTLSAVAFLGEEISGVLFNIRNKNKNHIHCNLKLENHFNTSHKGEL